MIQINMHEAKTHLSRYAKRIAAGEEIVIAKAGKPIMKLVPYTDAPRKRQPGLLKGKAAVVDDSVWFERDHELESMFEDGPPIP